MAVPAVSIVVPCRNEAPSIQRLLEALRRQDFTDFELIVVDGRSTDGTAEIVRRWAECRPDLSLHLVDNPRRSTPSALNLGIQHARGEVIIRLDGHSTPAPNYLSACLAVLAESGAEVVGGGWDIRPGEDTPTAEAIALAVSSWLGAGDAHYRLKSATQARDTDTVPYGCFRRKTWEQVGGYHEDQLANEDYVFNWRVRQRGGRVRFDPGIRCAYDARPDLTALARQYWRYGWWKGRMLRKYPGSLRIRQAVPMLWMAANGLLLPGGAFWPAAWGVLAALWAVYLAVVGVYSARLVSRAARGRGLWPRLVLAFVLIHVTWGCAACGGWLRGRPGIEAA